jgi:tetratricopeptide (TPR) repeat protein
MTHSIPSQQSWLRLGRRSWQRLGLAVAGASTLVLQFGSLPALADPFRAENPSDTIGAETEKAFDEMFREGDYPEAARILRAASGEDDDPLYQAMMASMAYLERDWAALLQRAEATQAAAEVLIASSDETAQLRGHLYAAVGIFLEGAHLLRTEGIAQGTPRALGMLQQVFDHLDDAEDINAEDPELSLLKGFMDLLLAVNLPFANPENAIARLDNYGAPEFVAQRGIAIGYRDLREYSDALVAVDAAIAAAGTTNPELSYLKAQILAGLGRRSDSLTYFAEALEYSDQLPEELAIRIRWEECVTQGTPVDTCSAEAGY